MAIESYQRHGEHVYLNGDSAKEIMQKALDHMEYQFKTVSRTAAFEDCTEYWKNELLKISATVDISDSEKWNSVTKLFRI